MKKLITLGLGLSIFLNSYSADNIKFMEEKFGDYALTLTGNLETYLKFQDNYSTPLDVPEKEYGARAGASNRKDQTLRVRGNIGIASGIPGETEFFSYLSFQLDANDPDNMDTNGDPYLTNPNYEEYKSEIYNAFVMWRPFVVKGKRPFGITIGQYTSKATINAAYSHKFSGDFDEDFIAYTATGLREKPMIALDLHTSKDTGFGYSYAKGSSDLMQIAALYKDEYSRTQVFWAEKSFGNLGFNAAYQFVEGSRGPYNFQDLDESNKITEVYTTENYDYSADLINAQLTYTLNLSENSSLKPFIGYQYLEGKEATSLDILRVDWQNKNPSARDIEADIKTGGFVYTHKLGKYKIKFAGEYSKLDTPETKGLGGIADGILDTAIESAGVPDFSADLTGGTVYNSSKGEFLGITGTSNSVSALAGMDAMYHIEASVEVSETVTVTLFYNSLVSKIINTTATNKEVSEIEDTLINKLGYTDFQATLIAAKKGLLSKKGINSISDLYKSYHVSDNDNTALATAFQNTGGAPVSTNDLAQYISNLASESSSKVLKWTDSNSVGISVKYVF